MWVLIISFSSCIKISLVSIKPSSVFLLGEARPCEKPAVGELAHLELDKLEHEMKAKNFLPEGNFPLSWLLSRTFNSDRKTV
jgi:hypothetical protein